MREGGEKVLIKLPKPKIGEETKNEMLSNAAML